MFSGGKMVTEGVVNLPDILPDESFLAGHAGLEFMELRNVMMKRGAKPWAYSCKIGGVITCCCLSITWETLVWDGDTGIWFQMYFSRI